MPSNTATTLRLAEQFPRCTATGTLIEVARVVIPMVVPPIGEREHPRTGGSRLAGRGDGFAPGSTGGGRRCHRPALQFIAAIPGRGPRTRRSPAYH